MKGYREWNPGQASLMPASPADWLKEDHLVYFLLELLPVLDLSKIEGVIHAKDARGTRPYSPRMMVGLLLYGYCIGKVSSRKLELATYEEVPFRVLCGDQHPDHSAISNFRQRHLTALGGLFMQILALCKEAGLVKLGHVALDGTKLKASASKHKAASYEGMSRSEERIAGEIEDMLKRAACADAEEDERFGKEHTGNELPEGLGTKAERLRRIQEAMAALEADAALTKALERKGQAARKAEKAGSAGTSAAIESAEDAADEADRCAQRALDLANKRLDAAQEHAEELASRADDAKGKRAATLAQQAAERVEKDAVETQAALGQDNDENGPDGEAAVPAEEQHEPRANAGLEDLPVRRTRADRDGNPDPKAQRSYTDPESQLMKDGNGFSQAYNCQAAVDQEHQIIVAAGLTNQASDTPHLTPMLDAVIENCGAVPETFTADAGYSSEENLEHCEDVGTDAYIPSRKRGGRQAEKGRAAPPKEEDKSRVERMRTKITTEEGRAIYARRKWVAEAPFGQIKEARGFRQLLLRGMDKAKQEWNLICAGHNLLKLFRASRA